MNHMSNGKNMSMGTDVTDYIEGSRAQHKTWIAKNMPHLNDFLSSQVGMAVSAYFMLPSGAEAKKSGRLIAVGDNYMVLSDADTGEYTVCSTDSLKFVSIKK